MGYWLHQPYPCFPLQNKPVPGLLLSKPESPSRKSTPSPSPNNLTSHNLNLQLPQPWFEDRGGELSSHVHQSSPTSLDCRPGFTAKILLSSFIEGLRAIPTTSAAKSWPIPFMTVESGRRLCGGSYKAVGVARLGGPIYFANRSVFVLVVFREREWRSGKNKLVAIVHRPFFDSLRLILDHILLPRKQTYVGIIYNSYDGQRGTKNAACD